MSEELDSGIIYLISNKAMPGLIKIGKTNQNDVQLRLNQLYTTGLPFPFEVEFACRVRSMDKVERALHTAFAPNRVNAKREFFSINPAQAIGLLKLLEIGELPKSSFEEQIPVDTKSDVEAGKQYGKRRPRLDFIEMGIPIGATLQSNVDDEKTAIVETNRKINYNGRVMSLTAATALVLGIEYQVAPGPYWMYNGKKISEIYDETYPGTAVDD